MWLWSGLVDFIFVHRLCVPLCDLPLFSPLNCFVLCCIHYTCVVVLVCRVVCGGSPGVLSCLCCPLFLNGFPSPILTIIAFAIRSSLRHFRYSFRSLISASIQTMPSGFDPQFYACHFNVATLSKLASPLLSCFGIRAPSIDVMSSPLTFLRVARSCRCLEALLPRVRVVSFS